MSADFDIDSISLGVVDDGGILRQLLDQTTEADSAVPWIEPGYEGKIDYRIRQLSYSSVNTLNQCARKYELYKRRSTGRTQESEQSSVTFAFGHVVGEGIQAVMRGESEEQVIMAMFLMWKPDLFAVHERHKKSFWFAMVAVQKFMHLRAAGFLKEYRLVYYNGMPATELGFCINFPDGFRLRGFVDAVLEHIESGEVLVLECKTTWSAIQPANYKNSAQAIGYSVVLDVVFPDISSYKVLYLVYHTGEREYTPIPFKKSYLMRAAWIRTLLLEIERIKMYEDAELYPMNGESCFSFGRECEYLQVCTLSTSTLTKPCSADQEDKTQYAINLTLADLVDVQMKKVAEQEHV